MDLCVFEPSKLPVVFRALRTAACGTDPCTGEVQSFLDAYAAIVGYRGPYGALETIEPDEVARAIEDRHQRKRLIQLASVASLVHRPVRRESAMYLRRLGKALATRDPILPVMDALSKGQRVRARMLSMRRMFRVIVKEAYASEGMRGVLRFFGGLVFKLVVNKDRLWSYKRLGLLPEGTLGREFWKHITNLGFGFPGELGGIPQTVAYHDVGHVLTGYSTQPEGEIQQGAFQAGNRREDGFVFLQFVLLQFHQGIRLTPVAKAETGLFDPHKVMWAVHRGSQVNVDITHRWSFWELMPLPLEETRRRLGLLEARERPEARERVEHTAPLQAA